MVGSPSCNAGECNVHVNSMKLSAFSFICLLCLLIDRRYYKEQHQILQTKGRSEHNLEVVLSGFIFPIFDTYRTSVMAFELKD